jgi:phosphatidylglycerophosphatase A
VGALWGWALVYALPEDPLRLSLALSTATVLAFAVCGRAERVLQVHDDPRIVVDETVGFWVAVAGIPRTLPMLAAGLLLFRAFDALKVPPFNRLERLPGGIGIVMDDVGAGVAANLLLRGALVLWPGALA